MRRFAAHPVGAGGFWHVLLGSFAVLLAGTASAVAREPQPDAFQGKQSARPVATPAAWAKPLSGGPIRTLFVAPQCTMRDADELARRIELELDAVSVWSSSSLDSDIQEPADGDIASGKTLRRLRDRLEKRCDLVIVANVDLSVFPEDVLDSLAKRVGKGAGLLLVHFRDPAASAEPTPAVQRLLDALVPAQAEAAITRGIGEALTPEWSHGLDFVRTYTLERGRVVELNYPGLRPKTHCLLPALANPLDADQAFFETYLSLVAKAARWAGARGRDPAMWVERVESAGPKPLDEAEAPPGLPQILNAMQDVLAGQLLHTFTVHFNRPADKTYTVRTGVRQPGSDLQVAFDYDAPLRKGASSYPVYVVAGPGQHSLDIRLLDDGKVVEWHTEAIAIGGWPDFDEVSFSKSCVLANDSLEIGCVVRGSSHQPRPVTLYARARDPLGRLVATVWGRIPPEGGAATLRLELADLMADQIRVEVFAADGDRTRLSDWDLQRAAYRYDYFPVQHRQPPEAVSLLVEADPGAEYNARAFNRALADCGVDTAYLMDAPAEEGAAFLPAANLRVLPQVTSYAPVAERDSVRVPCLTDPEFRKAEAAKLTEEVPKFEGAGFSVYSLGKGNCITARTQSVCQSPTCIAKFREALEVQYGAVSDLNAAWGTQFETWDQVTPAPEEVAARLKAYAPWMDFRRYMDAVFTDVHAFAQDVVRQVDKRAQVGFVACAAPTVYSGYDWAQLAPSLGFLAIPPKKALVETVRSLRSRDSCAAVLMNDDLALREPAVARWRPWYALLHGFAVLWWGRAYGDNAEPSPGAALAPDGQPAPSFLAVAEEAARMKAGIGEILLGSVRENCGIAIYSSQASLYLNHIEPSFGSGADDSADCPPTAAFMDLFERLGYQYDVISPEQVAHGDLAQYRLLVLPMTRALDDAEVEAIRRFHADGGHLIADVAPGQFNEHGLPRSQPPLADLFGVRHEGAVTAGAAMSAHVEFNGVGTDIAGVVADTSVRPTGATPCGAASTSTSTSTNEEPLWLVNQPHGAVALLMNHPLPRDLDRRQREGLNCVFRTVLDAMKLEPVVRIAAKGGRHFEGECVGYRFDSVDLVAVLASPEAQHDVQKMVLRLPQKTPPRAQSPQTVYDVIQGTRVGRTNRIPVHVARGSIALYASLPYKVAELLLTAPKAVGPGQRLSFKVQLKAEGGPCVPADGAPGRHVVHVELIPLEQNLKGQSVRYYDKNLVCLNGEGSAYISLAINERSGRYKLKARDVLTGTSDEAFVNVVGSAPKAR